MEVNGAPKQPGGYKLSSKYLPLCSAEQRNSYRFGTTWGWVNDDRIFIFGWTISLSIDFQFPTLLRGVKYLINFTWLLYLSIILGDLYFTQVHLKIDY